MYAKFWVTPVLAMAAGVLTFTLATPGNAEVSRLKALPPKPLPDEEKKSLPTIELPVYEWGVEALHWDGSARPKGDVPNFYYQPGEVPNTPPADSPVEPEKPKPIEGPVEKLKPVVYFAPPRDLEVNVEIKFANGKLTWMYPKPSRLVGPSVVQWDNLSLSVSRFNEDPKDTKGLLPKVDAGHWASYSREGSVCNVMAKDETERFLFYEGTNTDLPEIDVLRDGQGRPLVRNYSFQPIFSVRLCLPADGDATQAGEYFAAKVDAANGSVPGEAVLNLVPVNRVSRGGTELADEVMRAGLTSAQAAVFERCWKSELMGGTPGTLSYRRSQAALDEQTPILIAAPGHTLVVKSARIGYVAVGKIDLSPAKLAELDGLARKAAGGDTDAADKLVGLGMAGIGAVRRAQDDKELGLRQRLALATLLKRMRNELAR